MGTLRSISGQGGNDAGRSTDRRETAPRSRAVTPDRHDACLPAAVGIGFGLAAMLYNTALAVANAQVMPLTMAPVAVAELVLLSALAATMLRNGIRANDTAPMLLGGLFLLGALVLSFINQAPIVASLRNCAIIVLFTMLGQRCDGRTIRLFLIIATGVVFAVMLYELLAVNSYAALFAPQSYYANTRGIGTHAIGDPGLFPNALGFDGRFSYGLFAAPRTSSVFLEQTSLANFASVVVIYLLALWRTLATPARLLTVAFVLLALLSNNTRMSSTFALVALAGYFVFPRLPGRGTLALPLLLLTMAAVLMLVMGPSDNDDLAGRIGLSVHLLSLTDLQAVLGARALEANGFPDSGYSYVLYSSSIVGSFFLWLYVALIVPFTSDEQRRCAWGLALFFFINLLVAGNAVFAMKIAGPLWMLVGHMRSSHFHAAASPSPRRAVHPIRLPSAAAGAAA